MDKVKVVRILTRFRPFRDAVAHAFNECVNDEKNPGDGLYLGSVAKATQELEERLQELAKHADLPFRIS